MNEDELKAYEEAADAEIAKLPEIQYIDYDGISYAKLRDFTIHRVLPDGGIGERITNPPDLATRVMDDGIPITKEQAIRKALRPMTWEERQELP